MYIAAYIFNVYVGKGLHNSQGRRVLQFLFTSCGRPPQLSSRCCCVLLQTTSGGWLLCCVTHKNVVCRWLQFRLNQQTFSEQHYKNRARGFTDGVSTTRDRRDVSPEEKRLADDELPAARFNKKERRKNSFTALSNAAPKPLTTSHRHVVTGNEHSCTYERTNQKLGKTFLYFMNSKRLDNRQIGKTRECFLKLEIETDRRAC